MNLTELGDLLDERDLTMTIHPHGPEWVVWLHPPDDPVQIIVKSGNDLEQAVRGALGAWDGDAKAPPGDEPLVAIREADGSIAWRPKGAPVAPGEEALMPVTEADGTVSWSVRGVVGSGA